MANAFDELAEQQRQLRIESNSYSFWIKSKLLNKDELKKVFSWYLKKYKQVDNSGQLLVKIARQLPGRTIIKQIDLDKIESFPDRFRRYLKSRFANLF